jgi:hypothetical protein
MTEKKQKFYNLTNFARQYWLRMLMAAGLIGVFFGNAGFRSLRYPISAHGG